jgi:hypothetical protein
VAHLAARRLLRLAQARCQLLRLRRASGCLGTSCGSSCRSSSTTSPTPRVRVPRHVARLISLLVVDYFAYAVRPGASARRVARHVARRRLLRLAQARRRLLRLHRTSGCLGTSRGSSRHSSSTTSPSPRVRVSRHVVRLVEPLVVDYFAYAARPGALARRATHVAARCRLLRLRRASGCLGTSRGSSRGSSSTNSPRAGSSSTTSPTPCVRVPRHVAWLISLLVVDYFASRRLVVDYFSFTARPGSSARRAARRAACRRLLCLCRVSGCLGTSRGSSRRSSSTTSPRTGSSSTTSPSPRVWVPQHVARLVSPLVVGYFTYAARPGASARHAARHAACRLLLCAP